MEQPFNESKHRKRIDEKQNITTLDADWKELKSTIGGEVRELFHSQGYDKEQVNYSDNERKCQ